MRLVSGVHGSKQAVGGSRVEGDCLTPFLTRDSDFERDLRARGIGDLHELQ